MGFYENLSDNSLSPKQNVRLSKDSSGRDLIMCDYFVTSTKLPLKLVIASKSPSPFKLPPLNTLRSSSNLASFRSTHWLPSQYKMAKSDDFKSSGMIKLT